MISKLSINEVLEAVRIEEVIGDFVTLKKRGVNMQGLCPFHNEKTPSFSVSPSKGIFKCFGCGVAGDAIKFLMEHEHYSYPEAIRFLAAKYGIELEEKEMTAEERAEQQKLDSLYIVTDYARDFFKDKLFHSDVGKSVGLHYFKERGFREDIIKKFDLGFAPREGNTFFEAATQKGFEFEPLRSLGLVTEQKRDFFRGRVMFTIHNLTGKPIAFAGRILEKNVKAPKYINSPESEVYHKSKILYGIYQAQRAIRKEDECILVEGYTDVLSLHQGGIENVVASSGTSLTVEQTRLIKRNTPNLKILYDGDPAGVKAALRGLDIALEQDLDVKVVLLPEGEDPDSYLRSVGSTVFAEYLESHAQDFILFKAKLLLEETAGDPVKRTRLIKDIVSSIALIPDPVKRSLYIKECAQVMEVEEGLLIQEMNAQVQLLLKKRRREREQSDRRQEPASPDGGSSNQQSPAKEKAQPGPSAADTDEFQEKDIARVLIAAGSTLYDKDENITIAEYILSNIEETLNDFDNPLYGRVARVALNQLLDKEPLNQQFFLRHEDEEIRQLATDLLQSPYEFSDGWAEKWGIFLVTQKEPELNFPNDTEQALLRFKLRKVKRLREKNAQRIKQLGPHPDPAQEKKLIEVHMHLMSLESYLASELGTVIH